jgi:hypothetical protein
LPTQALQYDATAGSFAMALTSGDRSKATPAKSASVQNRPDAGPGTSDELSLEPYTDPLLTVGGGLNKLASNIATGRNMAGVH